MIARAAEGGSHATKGDQMGTTEVIDLTVYELADGQHRLEMRSSSASGEEFVVSVEGPADLVDADAAYLGQQYGVTPHASA